MDEGRLLFGTYELHDQGDVVPCVGSGYRGDDVDLEGASIVVGISSEGEEREGEEDLAPSDTPRPLIDIDPILQDGE